MLFLRRRGEDVSSESQITFQHLRHFCEIKKKAHHCFYSDPFPREMDNQEVTI